MAELIPLVIGSCGIPEAKTWTMTPAELAETANAHAKYHMQDLRFFDTLAARYLSLYASAHGAKNPKPADFLILPPEPANTAKTAAQQQTPEQQAFMLKLYAAIAERQRNPKLRRRR